MKLFFLLFCSSATVLAANLPLVTGVQGQLAGTTAFAAEYGLPEVSTEVGKFPNDELKVRFDPATDLAHHDVYLYLPSVLTSDQLLEALIKVHILQSSFAEKIVIASRVPLTRIQVRDGAGRPLTLDLPRLLRVAGAGFSAIAGEPSLAPHFLPELKPYAAPDVEEAVVASQSHDALARQIADGLQLPFVGEAETEGLHGKQVYLVAAMAPPMSENIVKSLARIQRYRENGNRVHLVTPYLPYARQDKVDHPGTAIAGSLVVRLLDAEGAAEMTFVRAHAAQSQGFHTGASTQLTGRPSVLPYLRQLGVTLIVSPDAGFQKDATHYAEELGFKTVQVINKQRDPNTGESRILGITDAAAIRGQVIAVPDDETQTGGTLAHAAKFLKELGAKKVYVLVTHITGPAAEALESPYIDGFITTDTLPVTVKSEKLVVLPIAPELVRSLDRLENSRRAYRPVCPFHVLAGAA